MLFIFLTRLLACLSNLLSMHRFTFKHYDYGAIM
jgi:hypothetical protein